MANAEKCGGRTEYKQRSETKRGKIREGGTLDPLLGCLPHTADPEAAPANPRSRATCVNKRIESVLVT